MKPKGFYFPDTQKDPLDLFITCMAVAALFQYPASKDKEFLTLRSTHFLLADGTTKYLVTNLIPDQLDLRH